MIGFVRTAAILSAIALGALIPQAHALAWLIRWLVMVMLFLVFLQARLSRSAVHRSHLVLLAANVAFGFAGWGAGWLIGQRDVALALFFCGITPTAIAAPVIISFLHGHVAYVVASFLLTNIAIAALMPVMLPVVLGRATPEAFVQVSASVGTVVFIPMALAYAIRRAHPPAAEWPRRTRNLSFGLWVTAIFLITSHASDFIRAQGTTPTPTLLRIAAGSLVLCVASFTTGRLIGGREFAREASQSLGQKNTTFTIYLALAYTSPLVALGPTFYVVWHNLWNSWQLHRATHRPPPG